jgi:hypothetical protein
MSPPIVRLSNGTLEALKWIGLAAMTGDHVNKYLFNGTLPALFEIGRVALPIFVFVLAYNLGRPGVLEKGAYIRTMKRLALFGAIAAVPYIGLGGLWHGWWPFNILFTLLVVTGSIYLIEIGSIPALIACGVLIIIGGGMVEFWWPAVIGAIAVWAYCKRPSFLAAFIIIASCSSLVVINENWWALCSFLVIGAVAMMKIRMPRYQWVFYVYYPLHLAVLWVIRIPMSRAGYLFF